MKRKKGESEIRQAQRFIQAVHRLPPEIVKALNTLLSGPPETVDAFLTVTRYQQERR